MTGTIPLDVRLNEHDSKLAALEADRRVVSQRLADLDVKAAVLDARAAAFEAGIGLLRNQIPAPSPPPQQLSMLEKIGAFLAAFFDIISKIVIPIAVVLFTWNIKDSVEAALKERELEVTTGTAMQTALTTLQKKERVERADAAAAALVLASMGKASILPLIVSLNGGSGETTIAVDNALVVLDITHQKDVCAALQGVIEDRGQRFQITTHKLAAKHLGIAQCHTALEALADARKRLDQSADHPDYFSGAPTPADIDSLRDAFNDASKRLR